MVMDKKIIAVIPARGGSKRIEKKNIIDFMGIPMIAWTIQSALKSNLFDDVIVSTDDPEIAEISKNYGASVPFLREDYTDDFSNVSDVTYYTLKKINLEYDLVVMLMPNCPLRNYKDIVDSINFFIDNNSNFQLSCFKYGWQNPHWAHEILEGNIGKPVFPKTNSLKRSQDLNDLYCITGAIWIADYKSFIEEKTFYGNNYSLKPLDWKNSVDIDDYEDLEMAKIIFSTNFN